MNSAVKHFRTCTGPEIQKSGKTHSGNMNNQTRLGIQNSKRSPMKVRQLTPEELGIPTGTEDIEGHEDLWEELRSKAASVASESGAGAAVKTDNGRVVTGTSLDEGVSRDVHALELAVWKAYEAEESPISDVAVVTKGTENPCGRCLQVVADYGLNHVTVQIIDGDDFDEYSLSDLVNIR